MTAPSYEPGRNALMLTELRLPTIGRLWPELAQRSDKEGWPAGRFLGGRIGNSTGLFQGGSGYGHPGFLTFLDLALILTNRFALL